MSTTSKLEIRKIKTDQGTQPRAQIVESVVADYVEALQQGATFPPVVVFYDGAAYYLADGFHRLTAAKRLDRQEISAEIRQGARRDAVLYSVGANATHGLPRTNDDKRRAVITLLSDSDWKHWSSREIARRCRVSHQFVNNLRKEFSGSAGNENEPALSGNGCQMDAGRAPTNASIGGTAQRGDHEIARECAVSEQLVSKIREGASADGSQIGLPGSDRSTHPEHANEEVGDTPSEKRIVRRGDTVFTMETENIGKASTDDANDEPESPKIPTLGEFRFQWPEGVTPPQIAHADCAEYLAALEEQVDLLFTDPPYHSAVPDIEEFAMHWVPAALFSIKPTGHAFVFAGAHPDELRTYLNAFSASTHLRLAEVICLPYGRKLGHNAEPYGFNWQAILHMEGIHAEPLRAADLVEQFAWSGPDASERRYHPGETPERLLERVCCPGDLVVDPFAGTGTFLTKAAELGCRAIGCEIDEWNVIQCCEAGCEPVGDRAKDLSKRGRIFDC